MKLKSVKVVIKVLVTERVLWMLVCQARFFTSAELVFFVDSLRSIVTARRSTNISITSCTSVPRVTSSKTRTFLWKPFTNSKLKRFVLLNLMLNVTPEEQRTPLVKRRELHVRLLNLEVMFQ